MSYVLVFSLRLRDQILYCTVAALASPANVLQTFPFGNFNFQAGGFTVNVSWQHRRLTDAASWSLLIWDCRAVWDDKYQRREPVAQLLLEAHPWLTHTHIHTHTHTKHCVIPKSLSTLAGSVETETCQCVVSDSGSENLPFNKSSGNFSDCDPAWNNLSFFFSWTLLDVWINISN